MCSKFRYTSTAYPEDMSSCFCVQCRKAAGGPYQTFARFPRSAFSWEAEQPKSYRFSSSVNRRFCDVCGSSLTFEVDERKDKITVLSGSIDDWEIPEEEKHKLVKPSYYVFAQERAAWYDSPNDGLPKWKGDNDAEDAELEDEQAG